MKQGFIAMQGKDVDGAPITRNFVESKLISIGKNTLKNSNGTEYHIGNIQFVTGHGELVTRSSQIWKKNSSSLVPGQEYLTEVRRDDAGKVYLTTSSLSSASRATADDFEGMEAPVAIAAQVASADLV